MNIAALMAVSNGILAQIPEGFYVAGAANPYGAAGMFVVDPRIPGKISAITGLSPELAGGSFAATGSIGIHCLVIRPQDGSVAAIPLNLKGGPTEVHVLTLSGLSVAMERRYPVGWTSPLSGPTDLAVLPNGDLLVGASPSAGPTVSLGVLSLQTGRVTFVGVSLPPPHEPLDYVIGAIAVDPSGSTIWFSLGAWYGGSVFRVSVAGGLATEIWRGGQAVDLALGDDGSLYMAMLDGRLLCLDLVSQQVSSVGHAWCVAVERATGDLAIQRGASVFTLTTSGVETTLASLPSSASGIAGTDIAVRNNPRTYGEDTPGSYKYTWTTFPNPGGLPQIGNTAFGLHLTSTAPTADGALLVSDTQASIPVAGIELLLGPAGLLYVGSMPASGLVPLSIPSNPALVGGSLFFQTLHLDPAGLAASDGLRMTVMQ